MASAFRLPSYVRPQRYALELALDPARSRRYSGCVRIELRLERAVSAIVLHAVDLKIRAARIETAEGRLRAQVVSLPEHEALRLLPSRPLAAGVAVLELRFSGRLRDDLRGLYFARSGKHLYAFSQLEAADARRFFPCFDEPSFKARFTLEVVTSARHSVLSNAREQSKERLSDGRKRVRFMETPPLSSYLVALAVGPLRASRSVRAGKTPIRVWHVPGQERLAAFALRTARECLLRLTRYFGIPYPYDKLDLVAVPDFDMGAMENAGAVFFRETLLLIDEQRATLPEKKRAAEVICHELAHMWYGNLVTMAWWDDLWLNEAFATWMAFEIVNEWQPELRMWNDFGHSRSSALGLDALRNTHPIYTRVRTPTEATQSFDLITYEKGAAVIRMLERYLGPARFRRGVRDYIRSHREGNATASDLWRALERHAGQAVASVVRPWVERSGFPLLRVRAFERGGRRMLVLGQERFSARGPKAAERALPWPLPIVLKLGTDRGERLTRHLLTRRNQRLALPRGVRFVYANADEGGFYRPLHDASLLRDLVAHLDRLNAAERLGLVTNTWAHVHAGYTVLDDFLELCAALADESDPDVLSALHGPLWHMLDRVAPAAGPGAAAELRVFIADVFGPALARAGLHPRKSEREHGRLRRAQLLSLVAVLAEDPATTAEVERRLSAYLRTPASLEANLVGPVVVVGARSAGSERHMRYLERSLEAKTPQERRRFRMALGEVRDPTCVEQTLRLCLDGQIPTQDVALVLARMLDNPFAREATWRFVRRAWPKLARRMPAMLVGRLIEATPALQTEAHRREVKAFFSRNSVPSAERALKQTGERFSLEAALRKRAAPVLRRWLAQRAAAR
jgi:puromycin-sensitive aminopeptidase